VTRELPDNPVSGASPALTPLFALREVSVVRGDAAILRGVTLDVPSGAITGIVGPSGSGKTTLIRLLNRLADPSAGGVAFLGKPLLDYEVRSLRRRVAFVFQAAAMFPGSVADNLRTAAELGGPEGLAAAPDPQAVLAAVGLSAEYAEREAVQLSGGEQQRVSLGRALMTRPEVLLLDEPTSALDPETASRLLHTVTALARERGVSVIMVTHRLSEARQVTTHTIMLEAGQVVEAGPTAQLFGAARSARARAYLASDA
jgi:UDP-glucose/iron transport system ATP-binding protein